jgi:circadian clock protein KaiB
MERENMTEKYLFNLYLSGWTPSNERIIANLKSILEDKLKEQYSLEIIYVTEKPELSMRAGVFSTPVLMKQLPPPPMVVVGDLTDKEKLLTVVEIALQQ